MNFNNADDFHAQQQAPTAHAMQPRWPGMLLFNDRFELVRPLGSGGMGEVWEAVDRQAAQHGNDQADGEVALKFLPSSLAGHPGMLQQFQKTFATLRKVQGRYLCPLYEMQVDSRVGHFIVMKRVHGHDLADVVRRNKGPLPLEQAIPIIEWAAAGLDELHEQRFAHRDVKPENIMLAPNDTTKLQIIDYGVSGEIRDSVARYSGKMDTEGGGTYIYMAPERWRGKPGGPAADQYALGCVAFFLLTGRPPFEGDKDILSRCHLQEPVEPVPGVPALLNDVLSRSMAKSPDERFPTCSEFAKALRAAAVGASRSPGVSVPPSMTAGPQRVVLPRLNVPPPPPPPPNDTSVVSAGNTRPKGIVLPRRRMAPTAPAMGGGTVPAPVSASQTYHSGLTSTGTLPGFAPVAAPVASPFATPESAHVVVPVGSASQQSAYSSMAVGPPDGLVARSSSLTAVYVIQLASFACWMIGLPIVLLADPNPASSHVFILMMMALSVLACLIAPIAFSVSSLVFYGIAWSSVPDGDARQPTSVAVALMLVPFFNIYWFYRWQFLLMKRLNASLQAARSHHPPINAELIWLQLIPFVGLIMCFVFQAQVMSTFRELRNAQ